MKAPSVKDSLDMDQGKVLHKSEQLRITAPPPPRLALIKEPYYSCVM